MQFGLFSLFDFFPDRQNEVTYYRDTLELLVYAEELGFDSVWKGKAGVDAGAFRRASHYRYLARLPQTHCRATA